MHVEVHISKKFPQLEAHIFIIDFQAKHKEKSLTFKTFSYACKLYALGTAVWLLCDHGTDVHQNLKYWKMSPKLNQDHVGNQNMLQTYKAFCSDFTKTHFRNTTNRTVCLTKA